MDADYAFPDSRSVDSMTATMELDDHYHALCSKRRFAVTAITEQTYTQLGRPHDSPLTKHLCGPTQYGLDAQGVFIGHYASGETTTIGDVYVIKSMKTKLTIITALHLVGKLGYTEL